MYMTNRHNPNGGEGNLQFDITFKTTLDKKYFLVVIGNRCGVAVVSKQDLDREFSASGFGLCPCNV